jgi:hypothetical protein
MTKIRESVGGALVKCERDQPALGCPLSVEAISRTEIGCVFFRIGAVGQIHRPGVMGSPCHMELHIHEVAILHILESPSDPLI